MASFPDGDTATLQLTEGWEEAVPNLAQALVEAWEEPVPQMALVIPENWETYMPVLKTLSIGVSEPEITVNGDTTFSGTAERDDGGPVGEVDLELTAPDGSTRIESVSVDQNGDYALTKRLDQAGEWTARAVDDTPGTQINEAWEEPVPPLSLAQTEGWE